MHLSLLNLALVSVFLWALVQGIGPALASTGSILIPVESESAPILMGPIPLTAGSVPISAAPVLALLASAESEAGWVSAVSASAESAPGWVSKGLVAVAPALPASAAVPLPLAEIESELKKSWLFWPEQPEQAASLSLQLRAARSAHALNQLLQQHDPYAGWAEASVASEREVGGGVAAGIGAELSIEQGMAWLWPRQGGALAQLGYRQPVGLLAVDGRSVHGEGLETLAAWLRGPGGSRVELDLFLPSTRWARYETVTVVRTQYRPLDVEVWQTPEAVVLRIFSFAPGRTRPALRAALAGLSPTPKLWLFDLRPAVGGDLHEALDLAADLLPAGVELGQLRSRAEVVRRLTATGQLQTELQGRPIVIWVGPQTASAAEILTSALQYHQRARVVGTPTFGKCFAQAQRPLRDGSMLQWTTLEFLLPDGQGCARSGISPDHPVRDPTQDADPGLGSRHYPGVQVQQLIPPELVDLLNGFLR